MHGLKLEKNWDLPIWRTWLVQWVLQASSEAFGKLYTFVRLLPLEIQEFTGVGLTPRDQDVWILNSKAFVHTFTFLVDKNFGKLKIFLNWFFSVFFVAWQKSNNDIRFRKPTQQGGGQTWAENQSHDRSFSIFISAQLAVAEEACCYDEFRTTYIQTIQM